MSKSVGGVLAKTGACLDTGADLATTPAGAPVLVLPCRDGDGQLPLPGLDILGAVLALVNALLAPLGPALPLPIAKAATSLFELVRAKNPVPAQMTTLPQQMMQLARR